MKIFNDYYTNMKPETIKNAILFLQKIGHKIEEKEMRTKEFNQPYKAFKLTSIK